MILRFLIRIFPLVLLAGLWEIAPRVGWVNPEALPPASAVASAWYGLLMSGDLVTNGVSSLINVSAGLALGIVVGMAAGVLMAWYPVGRRAGQPADEKPLSDAEIRAHPGDDLVVRIGRGLQDRVHIHGLPLAGGVELL